MYGFPQRSLVDRRLVRQRGIRNLGNDYAVILHAEQAISRDAADRDGINPHLWKTWKTSPSRPFSATSSIRSWDSLSMIS